MCASRSSAYARPLDRDGLPQCSAANRLRKRRFSHDVDGPTEESFEARLQAHQIQQRSSGLELYENVDIAVLALFATRDRSEDAQIGRTRGGSRGDNSVAQFGQLIA